MWVDYQAQIRNYILHFFTLIKRQAAIYFIGYSSFTKRLFQNTRLGICPVQNGKFGIIIILAHPHFIDHGCYCVSFFIIGIGRRDTDFTALLLFRIYVLEYLFFILMDQTVCRIYDILCRTVIAFQFEDTATRILIFELQDIIDIGSAERVNTLSIISHHTNTAMLLAKFLNDQMLGKVRILILVDQYKLKEATIFFQYLRMVTKQDIRLKQQIIEVHCSCLLATVLIALIYFT